MVNLSIPREKYGSPEKLTAFADAVMVAPPEETAPTGMATLVCPEPKAITATTNNATAPTTKAPMRVGLTFLLIFVSLSLE